MLSPTDLEKGSVKCSHCDPSSSIPHAIHVTRIRVNNLCCSGEEKIIRSSLEQMTGIENIAVNIIGRYAVIKHCQEVCCAPSDRIVQILNDKYLGASIQEVADEDGSEEEFKVNTYESIHVALVFLLFIIGLILEFRHIEKPARWIYIASIILGVGPIMYSSGISLFIRQSLDIHVLMLIAIAGAVASKDYFDGSLVVALFLGAEFIEQVVMLRVRKAVKMSSAGAIPAKASLTDGTSVKVEDIKVDMILAVRAGDMIMADGVVQKGEGVVDESALTGEAVPIQKSPGSEVKSGTIVQNGFLEVRVTSASAESTLQKLRQEVHDVQADRGRYAQLIDQFSVYWTPLVLAAAIAFVLISGGVLKNWEIAVHRGLLLLVLACPCAIVISAPIPAVCAIATAARNGVLIRGSSVVERMGIVDTVALDKTGTLTKGLFKVVNKVVLAEDREEGLAAMAFAAAIEEKSTHPLANAIVADHLGCIAEMAENPLPAVRKVKVLDGIGVSGWVEADGDWKYCVVGNERILEEHGGSVAVSDAQEALMAAFTKSVGSTVCLLVAVEDELMLMVALADEVRPESVDFVRTLQNMHMEVSMLTGDTEKVAKLVSNKVGIAERNCNYRLMPQQKLQWIRNQQHQSYDPAAASASASSLLSNPASNSSSSSNSGGGSPVQGQPKSPEKKKKKKRRLHIPQFARGISKSRSPAAAVTKYTELEMSDQLETDLLEASHQLDHDPTCEHADQSDHGHSSHGQSGTQMSRMAESTSAAPLSLCVVVTPPSARASSCCGEVHSAPVIVAPKTAEEKKAETVSLVLVPPPGAARNVLMVGDGINDSIALAAAAVGVAMGAGGSAMAVTAADVVLMSENLLLIPGAVKLCQQTRHAMIQNCSFAIGIKIVAIVLAVMGYLEFWHAILIDLGSLVVVIANGTRILGSRAFDGIKA